MIYITGSTGRLGSEAVKRFPNAKKIKRGDSLDFPNATAIIHLAGSLNFNDENDLWESNVEYTRKVVAATPKNARLLYASSIAVYGKILAEIPADEETFCHPDSTYAKTKHEGEKIALQHPNAVALRIAIIYGTDPKFKEFYTFLRRIERGRIFIIGNGKNRIPFVHVQDVAHAIKNAINAPRGIYVISGESVEQEKAYQMAAKFLGVPAPKMHVPLWIAKLFSLAGLIPADHISMLYHNRMFNCARAKKYLRFKPRPFQTGLKELVAAYKK